MGLLQVYIPDHLVEQAQQILDERGTDFSSFIRMQLKTLTKHSRFYGLADRYTFGKYDGEYMEAVIRTDPDYVAWCLRTVAGFGLTPEALEVLSQMGVDL